MHPDYSPHLTYIFSAGHAGSDILRQILTLLGLPLIVEPNLPTQLATLHQLIKAVLGSDAPANLIQAMNRSLAAHWGDRITIELHHQCNIIVDDIVSASPSIQAIFLFRHWEGWVTAMLSALESNGEQLAQSLRTAILAYHRLREHQVVPLLFWYEDIYANPMGILQQLGLEQRIHQSELIHCNNQLAQQTTTDIHQVFLTHWSRFKPECLDFYPELSQRLGIPEQTQHRDAVH